MIDDVVLNKAESIERCVRQIRTYYAWPSDIPFESDYLRQDAIAANVLRACEQAIDLANHVIKIQRLGLPKASRESFRILAEHDILNPDLAMRLEKMVGFRNILVHQYQSLEIDIMVDVIENRLDDLLEFTAAILQA